MGLFYAVPLQATPCHHQLPTDQICPLSSCTSTFPDGWVGVVIIKLKANLSSTSQLTSQLELSLAKKKQLVIAKIMQGLHVSK